MTTFQRLVKTGFDQGIEHGKELQLIDVVKKMWNNSFTVNQIIDILNIDQRFVEGALGKKF